jgi:cellulose biosynthesis protein BcsQ
MNDESSERAGAVTALVGATGGAGTTRLTLEAGALLARAGSRVAVFDAAFGTQGMAAHVDGRVETDLLALLAGDATPAAAMVEHPTAGEGALHLAPARAPFGEVARAKSQATAREFESTLSAATDRFDRVLVDTPPVAANQAVAAVTVADRVGAVAPATSRGVDATQRLRGRIEDVGATVDATVGNRVGPGEYTDAFDVVVPEHEVATPGSVPVADESDGEFAASVTALVRTVVGVETDLEFDTGGYLDRLR